MADPILLARHGGESCFLLPGMANRHGLITGATGTGKTVTLQKLAESFSHMGVPVFLADVKGDLTGISQSGHIEGKLAATLEERGLPVPEGRACPVTLWDVFGAQGHPVRATISDMGPLLLGRMLGLNDTQAGVLNIVFKIADDSGLLLLDAKDLRAMLQHVGDNAKQFTTAYGNISSASIGAIQRALLQIESQGGDGFFGEPMLDIDDMMQTAEGGQGIVNILIADKLMQAPRLYATFLLWLLSELFERLPEIGDPEKPKMVFFFDEAHLLFADAPKALLERIELVVRLVRSKGVGVYFVTQNPMDVPDTVLAQLGNRVQHALRAFTPRDQKAVRAAAETFRSNPNLDVAQAITELGVGEALVSFLDEKGMPGIVERAFILPPQSQLAPLSVAERDSRFQNDILYRHYKDAVDNFSAYEALQQLEQEQAAAAQAEAEAKAQNAATASAQKAESNKGGLLDGFLGGLFGSRKRANQGLGYDLADSLGSQVNKQITRSITRSIMGVIRNAIK